MGMLEVVVYVALGASILESVAVIVAAIVVIKGRKL